MIAEFEGVKVKIPAGYKPDGEGCYVDGHGVEYAIVQYGRGQEKVICLETVYSKHIRTIQLKEVGQ